MIPNLLYRYTSYEIRQKFHAFFYRKEHKRYKLLKESEKDGYSYEPFLRLKCIFIHIPKAAGVSVANSLFGNLAGGHKTIQQYQFIFSEEEFSSFFKFTIVRNPWERVFSAYNFLLKGGMHERNRRWAENNIACYKDFNDFIRNGLCKKEIQRYTHFKPQYEYVCLPFNQETSLNFLGFFENLEDDFRYICYQIFGNEAKPLLQKNRTSEAGVVFQEQYHEDTKKIVADMYGRDIALFGYDFENGNMRNQLTRRDSLCVTIE